MTLDEILALPERERDDLVAEKVMGESPAIIEWSPFSKPKIVRRRYSTNIADDFDVHRKMCKRTELNEPAGYFEALGRILFARRCPDLDLGHMEYNPGILLMKYYRVGDFSSAALMAVMEAT